MFLDISVGAALAIDGQQYRVVETSTYYEIDFRLDMARLSGPTPAHERWLVAVQPESYLMLMQPLGQDWLAPPQTSFVHDGETFLVLYQGSAYRSRRVSSGRSKEGRIDYALCRANSGRVVLTVARNEELKVWIGITLPTAAVALPGVCG